MPPAKRVEVEKAPEGFLRKGRIVNLTAGGRTLFAYEILDWDEHFVKFRADVSVSPQTEVVLIPYGKIEAIGLTDER